MCKQVPEVSGILELGNVWVFVQLIHRPIRTINQLYKNPTPGFLIPLARTQEMFCNPRASRSTTGLAITNGKGKVVVTAEPLRLDFYSDGELVLSANARNLMRFDLLIC